MTTETFKWALNCSDVPFCYRYGQVLLVKDSTFYGQDPQENPSKGVVFFQNVLPTEDGYVSVGYSLAIPPYGLQLTSKLYPIAWEEQLSATSDALRANTQQAFFDNFEVNSQVTDISLTELILTLPYSEELEVASQVLSIALVNPTVTIDHEEDLEVLSSVTSVILDDARINQIVTEELEVTSTVLTVVLT